MNILGIIPARGGSKGVPEKNIIQLCGKPLITYTIENAFKSKKRKNCAPPAPAHGLYLYKVIY